MLTLFACGEVETGPGRSGGQSPPRLLSGHHIFLTIPRATRWLNRCTAALTAWPSSVAALQNLSHSHCSHQVLVALPLLSAEE